MKIFLLGFSNESKLSKYLQLKATCLTCFLHVYINLLRKQQGCCNGNSDIDWWCFVFCFLFSVLIGCCRSHGQMPTSHCFAWQWASVAVSMTHCNYRRKAFPYSDFSVHSYHCSHFIWDARGSMFYVRMQGWRTPLQHCLAIARQSLSQPVELLPRRKGFLLVLFFSFCPLLFHHNALPESPCSGGQNCFLISSLNLFLFNLSSFILVPVLSDSFKPVFVPLMYLQRAVMSLSLFIDSLQL